MRTHSEPRDSTQRYSEGRARTRQSNRAAQPILTAMKQTLQLKLSQHLTLTPQLQQSIRLLQLSTMELNQELEKFLAENPLLEREDTDSEIPAAPHVNGEPATALQAPAEEPSAENSSPTDTFSADLDWVGEGGPSSGTRDDSDDNDFFQVAAESPSLREHLYR